MNNDYTILINNLAIGYSNGKSNQKIISSHIDLNTKPSTLTCIIGHNGTGKSTLLRTIAGLQPVMGGYIYIAGQPLDSYTKAETSRLLSIVLTHRPNLKNIKVNELVAMGRAPYTGFFGKLNKDDMRIVKQAVASAGIENLSDRKISSLSDGEMQKVMIAKAIAQSTPIILLDEPTAFLDFSAKIDIMLLLRELAHKRQKTIIMSTHDIETALQAADEIWLINNSGVSIGSPKSLVERGIMSQYIDNKNIYINRNTLDIQIKI